MPAAGPARGVFNGDDASTSFPRVVKVGNCSGTYICPNVILTATHCLDGAFISGAARITNRDTAGNDLAMIRLDTAIPEFTRIDVGGGVSKGDPVQIVGFGRATPEGSFGHKRSGIMLVSKATTDPLVFVPSATYNNQTACPGDSGGPAYAGGNLVGVASSVLHTGGQLPCGKVISAQYIPTEKYRTFINGNLDNWCSPVVQIEVSDPSGVEPDEGVPASDKARFVIRRLGPTDSRLEVQLKGPGGTATEGTDYDAFDRTVVFESGQATKYLPIIPLHDEDFLEPVESVAVGISPSVHYSIDESKAQGTVYISSFSIPTVELFIKPGEIAEGEQADGLMLRTGGDTTKELTVRLSLNLLNPEAVYGRDTDQFPLSVTFLANQKVASFKIKALADEEDEEPTEFLGLKIRESTTHPEGYLTLPETRQAKLAINNNPKAEPEPPAPASSDDPFADPSPAPASPAPVVIPSSPEPAPTQPPASPTPVTLPQATMTAMPSFSDSSRITKPAGTVKGLPLPR